MSRTRYGVFRNTVTGREEARDEIHLVTGCGNNDAPPLKLLQNGVIGFNCTNLTFTLKDRHKIFTTK